MEMMTEKMKVLSHLRRRPVTVMTVPEMTGRTTVRGRVSGCRMTRGMKTRAQMWRTKTFSRIKVARLKV